MIDDGLNNLPPIILKQLILSHLNTAEKSKVKETNKNYSKHIQIKPRSDYNTTVRKFLLDSHQCQCADNDDYPMLRHQEFKNYTPFYCSIQPLMPMKISQQYIPTPYGPSLTPISCCPPKEIILDPVDEKEKILQIQQLQQINNYIIQNKLSIFPNLNSKFKYLKIGGIGGNPSEEYLDIKFLAVFAIRGPQRYQNLWYKKDPTQTKFIVDPDTYPFRSTLPQAFFYDNPDYKELLIKYFSKRTIHDMTSHDFRFLDIINNSELTDLYLIELKKIILSSI